MIKNTEQALFCLLAPVLIRYGKGSKCKACNFRYFCVAVGKLRMEHEKGGKKDD